MLTNYAVSGKSTKEIIEVDDNSDDEAPVPLPQEDTPVATPDIEMIDIPDGEAPDNEEEDMPKGVPERKSPENQEGAVPDVVVPDVMPANEVVQLPEETPVPEDIVVPERTPVVKETVVPEKMPVAEDTVVPEKTLMSLVCSRREQTKTNLYPGAFSPQQHRDHSEERARKYCETTRIETERENDN